MIFQDVFFPYPNKQKPRYVQISPKLHTFHPVFVIPSCSAHWGVASQLVDALWTALAEVRVPGPLHTPTVQSEMVTLVNRGKNVYMYI